MIKFIAGFVFGVMVCTIGAAGILKLMDNGVSKVQQVTREAAQ